MKNNKGFAPITIVIIIIAVLAVGGGVYYFGKSSKTNPKNTVVENNVPQENQNIVENTITTKSPVSENITCSSNSKYFVISKISIDSRKFPTGGTDFLIKYKKGENQNIACDYSVEKNDFEIKNNGENYFMALEGKFLLVDSGTAASVRGLTIYDLEKRSKILEDSYCPDNSPSRAFVIKNNTVTYWVNTPEPVNAQNCPQFYNSGGRIVSHILFDMSTLVKKDLGEKRCIYEE